MRNNKNWGGKKITIYFLVYSLINHTFGISDKCQMTGLVNKKIRKNGVGWSHGTIRSYPGKYNHENICQDNGPRPRYLPNEDGTRQRIQSSLPYHINSLAKL
jgi:hypothetical protein